MTLDLVYQNFTSDKSFKGEFFKKILTVGVGELGLKGKGIEISLSLVDQSKIRELNKKYRKKDKATDVLSFPMLESDPKSPKPKAYSLQSFDLGDIFICLSFAKNEAKSENVSIERKFEKLTVHGFLHLAGYDHPDDEVSGPQLKRRGEKMESLENKILKVAGF